MFPPVQAENKVRLPEEHWDVQALGMRTESKMGCHLSLKASQTQIISTLFTCRDKLPQFIWGLVSPVKMATFPHNTCMNNSTLYQRPSEMSGWKYPWSPQRLLSLHPMVGWWVAHTNTHAYIGLNASAFSLPGLLPCRTHKSWNLFLRGMLFLNVNFSICCFCSPPPGKCS